MFLCSLRKQLFVRWDVRIFYCQQQILNWKFRIVIEPILNPSGFNIIWIWILNSKFSEGDWSTSQHKKCSGELWNVIFISEICRTITIFCKYLVFFFHTLRPFPTHEAKLKISQILAHVLSQFKKIKGPKFEKIQTWAQIP